ncbi:hypothetical protein JOD82_002267 [Paenibacillus sp. 1182]|uniref:hypothetical protein n=1 Tax=Paenibacillus sp. 1182 TaxID=2806565 RepID=UPI001AE769F5|nr:hypothetical protein [Paenibacillus sp. 1182]MBP1309247.1 hypothetical protein [Paenibacillus sp. 1182]
MIKLLLNPHPNNYVVFCENEDFLEQVLTDFESFLLKNHLRLYVKVGRIVPQKCSFDFKLTTTDKEERNLIMSFLKPSNNRQ